MAAEPIRRGGQILKAAMTMPATTKTTMATWV
jgi:hypothetical protein